jgi:hypothetical protein
MTKWIKTDIKRPEHDQEVLFYSSGRLFNIEDKIHFGYYDKNADRFILGYEGAQAADADKVSHWCEKPSKPSDDNDNDTYITINPCVGRRRVEGRLVGLIPVIGEDIIKIA